MTPRERIAAFRDDLPNQTVGELVQRHITYGNCYALTDDAYYRLKHVIGREFGIHQNEIVVVGSAKLGFSIAPEKRYREFGEKSDIDVALCSSTLFDMVWQNVFDYWKRGEFWYGFADFRKYFFRGWIRPDKLPPATSFRDKQELVGVLSWTHLKW